MPENERTGPRHRDRPGTNTPAASVPPTGDNLRWWIAGYLAGNERGYWERVAEENGAWPPKPVRLLGKWLDQAEQRRKWDDAVRREAAS